MESLPVMVKKIPGVLWAVFWIETLIAWMDFLAFFMLGAGNVPLFIILSVSSFLIGVVSFLLYWGMQAKWHELKP